MGGVHCGEHEPLEEYLNDTKHGFDASTFSLSHGVSWQLPDQYQLNVPAPCNIL